MMEGKTLYLECTTGISGDMMVAALLDLGASQDTLQQVLQSMPVQGFHTVISHVKKAGLELCDFDVVLGQDNHDHDMKYLHDHDHDHNHNHDYSQEHYHHSEHHHAHEHRGMNEIRVILEQTQMTEQARATALRIFTILAKAEAKAHGVSEEQVHFHEVGAVDSIVDIVSVAVCLDNLGITECIVPFLTEGTGTIRCQHGILPIPVPAVVNIVEQQHLSLAITNTPGEFVTPTGAAIVAAVRTSETLPSSFRIQKTGMGAGKREYERPSILRAMLIEADERMDVIYKLECNVDDCSGEALGYVMERLFAAGARDVYYMPVFMKKNRPACQLNVICKRENIECLEQIIFKETTTIGIRRHRMERSVLPRTIETIQTPLGEAKVKVCQIGEEMRRYPEYESVVALCKTSGKSFQEVFRMVASQK